MIELKRNRLTISFPEVHEDARMEIDFQRTLRIPDDGREHFLPPGLGSFPLRHVDDFAEKVPGGWLERGGVSLPMYQSEALWLNFSSHAGYPFLLKVAAGKVNAVTGENWTDAPARQPEQDYLVVPAQPWLDGFCVERGIIRQFVAMPLGAGYSAEEQITGAAEHGGLQVAAYPMKASAWKRHRRRRPTVDEMLCYSSSCGVSAPDMALAPGGRMRQEIYDDEYDWQDWDLAHSSRCFVHIANSLVWRAITGEDPPTVPPTAKEYTDAGLPWFDYYDERPAREGSERFSRLKSVAELAQEKGGAPLPENAPVTPENVIALRRSLTRDQVREGRF